MKTMTCSQLGGPAACTKEFHAETFEEMAQMAQDHAKEMADNGDKDHMEVMDKMKDMSSEDMDKWMEEKKAEFEGM